MTAVSGIGKRLLQMSSVANLTTQSTSHILNNLPIERAHFECKWTKTLLPFGSHPKYEQKGVCIYICIYIYMYIYICVYMVHVEIIPQPKLGAIWYWSISKWPLAATGRAIGVLHMLGMCFRALLLFLRHSTAVLPRHTEICFSCRLPPALNIPPEEV